MKLNLSSVTLCCIDGVNASRAIRVLEHCKSLCDFGDVKLLTHIPNTYEHSQKIMPLNSLIAYSIFMLTRLHEFIETEKILIVQRDGFIINPSSWKDEWVQTYDYIGPLFIQYPLTGSGGFSLRSKKLMEATAERTPKWNGTQKDADRIQATQNFYEDGVICLSGKYKDLNIAPPEVACEFAQGGCPDMKYYRPYPFGFHGTINAIQHDSGFVSPVCEHGGSSCACVADHVNYLQKMSE